jgi:hypothetical protein
MIGFWVINLLVPEEPKEVTIGTPTGDWLIDKNAFYDKSVGAIRNNHQCATTYAIQNPVSMKNGAAACDAVLEEMTPLTGS